MLYVLPYSRRPQPRGSQSPGALLSPTAVDVATATSSPTPGGASGTIGCCDGSGALAQINPMCAQGSSSQSASPSAESSAPVSQSEGSPIRGQYHRVAGHSRERRSHWTFKMPISTTSCV